MTFSLTYHLNSGEASPHRKSLLMDLDQACRSSGEAPKSTEPRQERTVSGSSEAPAHPAPASPNTPISHEPQHDAESVFRLLWFLLARANPKDHPPVLAGSHEQVAYDSFCNDRLGHTVGNIRDSRSGLMTNKLTCYESTLHPQFKSLGKMLYWMGKYLHVLRDK